MSEQLKTWFVKQNTEGWYLVYRIIYATELDFLHVATLRYKEDLEDFTKGDY